MGRHKRSENDRGARVPCARTPLVVIVLTHAENRKERQKMHTGHKGVSYGDVSSYLSSKSVARKEQALAQL
jgi:hypothetical protein